MSISFFIQAVPERETNVLRTMRTLSDFGFPSYISWDYKKCGPLSNFKEILRIAENKVSQYVCVLQDDLVLSKAFGPCINDIAKHNLEFVSLFVPPRQKYLTMPDERIFYFEREFLWMQALMFKRSHVSPMLNFWSQERYHDDVFVGEYCKSKHI